ncbi:MAG: AzlC family ABC transporter permease [Hyphomicrobiaceae bacterium]
MTEPIAKAQAFGFDGAATWSPLGTLARGMTILFRVPAAVLCASSMGYGALAHDSGLDLGLTLFINATLFALPAQVVLVDQMARGATLAAAAFAVALTAIRLLPMTVSLMPFIRDGDRRPRFGYLAAHFIAISVWVDCMLRLPALPPPKRFAYFLGMGLGMMVATLTGSTIGYLLASSVPPVVSAALLFMSPAFFWLSQVGTAKIVPDWVAIAIGCIIGPILFQLVPGLDLLLAGVIGGTIAFMIGKQRP